MLMKCEQCQFNEKANAHSLEFGTTQDSVAYAACTRKEQNKSMIEVFLIAQTRPNEAAIKRWMECLGTSTDITHVSALAAKRCYNSFEPGLNPNVTKVRSDLSEYLKSIIESKHGSVFEHATYSFAIEGLSRVCTAELNRHRAGVAISEGSMRYIRFDDIPYYKPENANAKVLAALDAVFSGVEEVYKTLVEDLKIDDMSFADKKKITSLIRRIVPMGVSTGGVWTFNLRALRHIITLRTSPHAEREIVDLFCKIMAIMQVEEPDVFQDFEYTNGWVPGSEKI